MKLLYTLIFAFFISCSTEPEDCAGVEGGSATIDDCEQCVGGTTGNVANYLKDCAGICSGTTIQQVCDDCESQIFDCEGVCGGTAAVDYEGLCGGTAVSDNNYEIDTSFRYPSNVGSYWEYSCVAGTNFSTTLESTTLGESMASLKIINNNSVPDSCGNNAISFFKTDSIIYLLDNDPFRREHFFMPDSVSLDTLFYTHSSEQFSFCSSAQLKAMNKIHTNTNPPTLQYPLMIGSTWSTEDSLFTIDYEVLGEETILIDLKDGTNVNMNCFILSMNLGFGTRYYYLSSIGLVKSSSISEPMEVTTSEHPGGTGETFTIEEECTLIDY